MIILISGSSHTGKTLLAQKLMEKKHMPYYSIDHLKMGLIRSGQTSLSVEEDDQLTEYLWPIVAEIIKTAIENHQHLIIEGCYIPFDWKKSFEPIYLKHIRYICLIFTENYIEKHFQDVLKNANAIEHRMHDYVEKEALIKENRYNLAMCLKYQCTYFLINEKYNLDSLVFAF